MNQKPTCHPERPYKALGRCASCYQSRYAALHPEYAAKQREWHKKASRTYSQTHKRQRQISHIENTYGIPWKVYQKMISDRKGCCDMCHEKRKLMVDHDHKTGRIRGLLCSLCNTFLGVVDRNIVILKRMKAYVEA